MRPLLKGALIAALVLALLGAVGAFAFIKVTGLSARATPGPMETAVARRVRAWAVPADYREHVNPVLRNDASIRNGLEHFADHCAVCHGNDGSGSTEMGKGMFPPAPDMRAAATQELTDGELFYIIEHGVRFTGMPAWGTGTIAGEEASWHLVNFIRRLPGLTPDEIEEMAAMNPRPPAEVRQEIEAERFLQGGDPTPVEPSPPHGH
jgi:mono/diheme cytochrome c family protein